MTTSGVSAPKTSRKHGEVGPHYKWVALSNTTLGMFMAALDSSIVLISLPAIFRGIRLDPLQPSNVGYLLWMLMGYLVVTAVLVVTLRAHRRHLRPGAHVQPRLSRLHRRVDPPVAHTVDRQRRGDGAHHHPRGPGRRRRHAHGQLDGDPHRCLPGRARHGDGDQHDRGHRRLVHRPDRRRVARRHRLAAGVLGQRAVRVFGTVWAYLKLRETGIVRRSRGSTGGAT